MSFAIWNKFKENLNKNGDVVKQVASVFLGRTTD